MAKELNYEIKAHVGVISEASGGWRKELNLISWNGNAPKYDIRSWSPDREKMGKGIVLSEKEMDDLMDMYTDFVNR